MNLADLAITAIGLGMAFALALFVTDTSRQINKEPPDGS